MTDRATNPTNDTRESALDHGAAAPLGERAHADEATNPTNDARESALDHGAAAPFGERAHADDGASKLDLGDAQFADVSEAGFSNDEEFTSDAESSDPLRFSIRNVAALAGVTVLLFLGGVFYVSWASSRVNEDLIDREIRAQAAIDEFEANQPTPAPRSSETDESPTSEPQDGADEPAATVGLRSPAPIPGEVLVVNRAPGEDYGRLAIRHADGSRTLLERECTRVHIAAERGVCLSQIDGVVTSFATSFFDPATPETTIKSYASALPSRARISPDGRFSSVTAFISGASYEDIGGGSSTIVTIDDIDGSGNTLTSLVQYEVDSDDPRYDNLEPQYWGMTFANDDEFYVTGFFGDEPEVMRGSIETQTLVPTGWDGSCPSLSPDGKTIVFKEPRLDGGFSLAAVDIESGRRWVINESKSVDDQVEWLDNDTILYAVHPDGGDTPVQPEFCLLYTSPSPRDATLSRMPSSA